MLTKVTKVDQLHLFFGAIVTKKVYEKLPRTIQSFTDFPIIFPISCLTLFKTTCLDYG